MLEAPSRQAGAIEVHWRTGGEGRSWKSAWPEQATATADTVWLLQGARSITDLEAKVSTAEVIDPPTSGDRVTFGSTVKLEDEDGKQTTYQIVGSDEAEPKRGLISVMSPLARTLIGKKVGDRATAQLPGGKKTFEILAANFALDGQRGISS